MDKLYAIGVDFGTLSGRAVIVDIETGEEVGTCVYEYPHGVMDEALPCGKKLEPDFALEHPQDYLDVLSHTIPAVLQETGISAKQVIGVGIDHTACTVIPVKQDGTPLCFFREFEENPHAYVKLWKHHAAQPQADAINALAESRGESFLQRYGGKISSEWLFPKVLQIAQQAPEVFDATDRFIEATDWVVWQLTGVETHNSCTAGYKGMYSKREGYPSNDFFKALDPKLDGIIGTKVSDKILPLGTKAGGISEKAAALTGLPERTPVAVGNVDAHVALPAVGITQTGKMLMIMGTSTCHILMSEKENIVPGMCGVVEDGVLAGSFGYEAGQSCVGDHFDWFVKNSVPASYVRQAEQENVNIHKFLREKAKRLKPGESGLVALDWFNGNRSVLVDADLTGLILGMTLQTKPEEIYRALIEATAYGTRMIIDNYEAYGVTINELFAAGGIAEKDEMMMQIYADVTGRTIRIAASAQSPALGSAIFGAACSGRITMEQACKNMGKVKDVIYTPVAENKVIYDRLYQEYKILHDTFGRGENDVMKHLKKIKKEVSAIND